MEIKSWVSQRIPEVIRGHPKSRTQKIVQHYKTKCNKGKKQRNNNNTHKTQSEITSNYVDQWDTTEGTKLTHRRWANIFSPSC